jgi:signal transduction histidine kinase
VLTLVSAFAVHSTWERTGVVTLLTWGVLCTGSNLLPVPAAANVYLSMSGPVNVAIALVLPPAAAATVVFAASVSEWELRRATSVLHAVFNRGQLALATAATAAVLATSRSDVPTPAIALAGVVTYQGLNWLLVAGAERTARGVALRTVLARLLPRERIAAVTYLVLGLMGIALGLAYLRVGAWAVPILMLPLVGARYTVQASQDLERLERERRQLGDRLAAERERERLRIASDIHDVVLQKLAAIALQADNVTSALEQDRRPLASELASGTKSAIADVIGDLRDAIDGLRRVRIAEGGLLPAVARFAGAFSAETGIEVAVQSRGFDTVVVAPTTAALVYECCREGLVNVAQHAADATRADVVITATPDALCLDITDDGNEPVRRVHDDTVSVGLTLLREKLAFAGGSLRLESLGHRGSRLSVRLRRERGR